MRIHGVLAVAILLGTTASSAPVLLAAPEHQSVVRGHADDLLMLAGADLSATSRAVLRTVETPEDSRALPVVSTASTPHAITIKLPADIDRERTYEIQVTAGDAASNVVRINDARPHWFTPSQLSRASQPLRVVGRNLRSRNLRLRLVGNVTAMLAVAPPRGDIGEFVREATLPASLRPGDYRVEWSNDDIAWQRVGEQWLRVRADTARRRLDVREFGACRPDDGADDSACFSQALDAAARMQNAEIVFTRGVWQLDRPPTSGKDGFIVPRGVDVTGDARSTILLRGTSWTSTPGAATLTLLGLSRIRGFTFADAAAYEPTDAFTPSIRLGSTRTLGTPRAAIENITVSDNRFAKVHTAIEDSGAPVAQLTVTHNEFGAYREAIRLDGNRYEPGNRFRIDDAVIRFNVFKPGSYLDERLAQGAIASEIGASSRMDFSDNVADGTAVEFLNAPDDARGWRAGFFWHLNGNNERLLVANNQLNCTGDKSGDGEAIAFDNNANTLASDRVLDVAAADATSVALDATPRTQHFGRATPEMSYYIGHWAHIVTGAGLGQARKIVAVARDPNGRLLLTVTPRWDVPPRANDSRIIVGRKFWQVYTLANRIDNRAPACVKSNRTRPRAGAIALWAPMLDSVVEGNSQFDTDGIVLQQLYESRRQGCEDCELTAISNYFVDVRRNRIEGEYDWRSDCSHSGIQVVHGAAASPGEPPPVLNFGVAIAENSIRHADGLRGGGITVSPSWHRGPPPSRWNVVENLLIYRNVLEELDGPGPVKRCDHPQRERVGINLYEASLVHGTVLNANRCRSVARSVFDSGRDTTRLCDSRDAALCECSR